MLTKSRNLLLRAHHGELQYKWCHVKTDKKYHLNAEPVKDQIKWLK